MSDAACSETKNGQNGFIPKKHMPKPSSDEIQEFFKSWWLSNYMVPLNKPPIGMVEFISAFYDKYCTESKDSSDS